MTVSSVSQGRADIQLPEELKTAQEAIYLPEVQEMLKKLSGYNLGIYMPHMHDERTGEFQPLPAGITQVEDSLQVSFRAADEVEQQSAAAFVPVAWFWRNGVSTPMVCTARCVMQGSMHTSGHTST
jgi:hypothetical protein